MEDGLFSSREFAALAANVVLLVHNKSLVKGVVRDDLAAEKQLLDCASICLMDADGRVMARPAAEIAELRRAHAAASRVLELRRRDDADTPVVRKELFLLELRLRGLGEPELATRAAGVDLTDAEREEVARYQTDLAVRALLADAQASGAERVAESIYVMARQGRCPGAESHDTFWLQALTWSARCGDSVVAERAEVALRSRSDRDPPATPAQAARWRELREAAARRAAASVSEPNSRRRS